MGKVNRMAPRARSKSAIDGIAVANERALLAAAINGIDLPEDIGISHFSLPTHRDIFRACVELRESGTRVNLLSLTGHLISQGLLSRVGGPAEVTEISNEPYTNDVLDHALDSVREYAVTRQAHDICQHFLRGDITFEKMFLQLKDVSRPPKGNWQDALATSAVLSTQLKSLQLEVRQPLLGEWLREGDYGIIYAPRGVGKTWCALLIAKAISSGGKLGDFQAPAAAKVMYIDGEMPPDLMRERDQGLGSGDIEYLNHEILFQRTGKVLNIATPEVQNAILTRCLNLGVKLLILDNLSTLASGVKENDSFEWEQLHNWLLQFRRHRIAVILVHHASRGGYARGTSKREDAAFWVIALDDTRSRSNHRFGAHSSLCGSRSPAAILKRTYHPPNLTSSQTK